jgi:Mechanosensitive ion channel, conserved TM helix
MKGDETGVLASLDAKGEALLGGAKYLLDQAMRAAPRILTAIAVLVGLWLVAIVLRAIVGRVLRMTKLDAAVTPTPVGRILKAFNKDLTPSAAIAKLVYIALLLVALTSAADMVGLDSVGKILTAILGYLPSLLSAVLIVAAGGYFANVVSEAVSSILKEMRSPYAKPLAGITEGAILVVVFTIAIDKLGVDLSFITANLTLILGASTLTLCFLFGWSMRGPAEQIIANYYLRRMVSVGDRIVLGDAEGTVERFAPIGLLLREDDGVVRFVPAHHVLSGMRRHSARPGE